MLRIALIAPLFESVPPRFYGGTERIVYNLCRGLTEADMEVTLFASGDSSTEGRIVPVIDEALRLRRKPVTDPIPYHLKMLSMVAQRAHEFDVIHNHHDYWMLPLTEMTDTPVLTTLHGRLDLPDIAAAFYQYPKAHYVSISDRQRQGMPRLRWARTILHGIEASDFVFHEKPGKYLAFLGRMSRDKRPDWAIRMAKLSGVPLKMAAKIEGKEDEEFFETHVKPHIDGRFIEYVGEISESEKSEFLGGALALAFPIDWPEPFGLVVLEALACGTPVLARPMGAVPEITQDGVTGFIRGDVAELARLVHEVPGLKRAKCRQWVEEKFSLKRMTEDYIHVYRHLAQFAGARARKSFGDARWTADHHRRNLVHTVERLTDGNT